MSINKVGMTRKSLILFSHSQPCLSARAAPDIPSPKNYSTPDSSPSVARP